MNAIHKTYPPSFSCNKLFDNQHFGIKSNPALNICRGVILGSESNHLVALSVDSDSHHTCHMCMDLGLLQCQNWPLTALEFRLLYLLLGTHVVFHLHHRISTIPTSTSLHTGTTNVFSKKSLKFCKKNKCLSSGCWILVFVKETILVSEYLLDTAWSF